jgi:uncharacterized repeat protein (TIGR02543 family)
VLNLKKFTDYFPREHSVRKKSANAFKRTAQLVALCLIAMNLILAGPSSALAIPQPCVGTGFPLGDSGTSISPVLIDTAAKLVQLSTDSNASLLSGYYKLTADIDLGECLWTPIGNSTVSGKWFLGSLDGGGHLVSNFTINGVSRQGFIGFLYTGDDPTFGPAEVKNLGIVNATVVATGDLAGILVALNRGTIQNVFVTGSVTGNATVGGLVGQSLGTNVSGPRGTVTNSYSSATVQASSAGNGVGGLMGYLVNVDANISNSYSSGAVSASGGTSYVGGLLGQISGSASINNSYYDSQTSGQSDSGKGTAKTTLQLQSIANFTGWNIVQGWEPFDGTTKIWGISPSANSGYPFLLFQYTGSVTFDATDGLGSMPVQFGRSSESLEPNTYTRAGYTFRYWTLFPDGSGTTYSNQASYPFSANQTLYAQWTADSHVVTYNTDGGSSVAAGSFNTDGSMNLPSAPTKSGYVFNGWFTSPTGGTALSSPYSPSGTSNITLYAQWSVDPSGGGSSSLSNTGSHVSDIAGMAEVLIFSGLLLASIAYLRRRKI